MLAGSEIARLGGLYDHRFPERNRGRKPKQPLSPLITASEELLTLMDVHSKNL